MNLLRRALKKPPDVLLYRAVQETQLRIFSRTGAWRRIDSRVRECMTPQEARSVARRIASSPIVMAPDGAAALRTACASGECDAQTLIEYAKKISARQFEIFEEPLPHGAWPWHSDWRFGKVWPRRYFRDYDFYEPRDRPYDAKFPWELSRLGFLLPLVQAYAIDGQSHWLESAQAVLDDWDDNNPLAFSINWVPMEASMRAITITLLIEMLCLAKPSPSGTINRLLVSLLGLLARHGEFIWRTVEYTDVRGNHYAANLCALLLAGNLLGPNYAPAQRWRAWAESRAADEITLQFLEDGVNFEKSVAYHRLVTEIFLLVLLASQRSGKPLPASCEQRVWRAASYMLACRRPDGCAVDAGDNDSAQILHLEPNQPADHGPAIGLAAALFSDGFLRKGATNAGAVVAWLTGTQGLNTFRELIPKDRVGGGWFADAGIATARSSRVFFWADFGEVGMNGRGGHGHNDTFSFELAIDGVPVIIDPGTYVYTADAEARNLFRSSIYHNVAVVDGEEMAPFSGFWRISDVARPCNVTCLASDNHLSVRGEHAGYARLPDPVLHGRELCIDLIEATLTCQDSFVCRGAHTVRRYLHFPPGVALMPDRSGVTVSHTKSSCRITWESDTFASVESYWLSTCYAKRTSSQALCLTNSISGSRTLTLSISPTTGN